MKHKQIKVQQTDNKEKEENKNYKTTLLIGVMDQKGELQSNFEMKELYINQYGIYYQSMEIGQKIERIEDMIRLDELLTEEEKEQIKKGKELPRVQEVSEVKMESIGDTSYQTVGMVSGHFPCIDIEHVEQERVWRLCGESSDQGLEGDMQTLRNQVVKRVIQHFQHKYHQHVVTNLVVMATPTLDTDYHNNWSYSHQQWLALCQDQGQSPINIQDNNYNNNNKNNNKNKNNIINGDSNIVVVSENSMSLELEYRGDSRARVVRGLNEQFFVGRLGEVNLRLNQNVNKYCGWRVELKYPGEHTVNQETFPLEMLVYHQLAQVDTCDYQFLQAYSSSTNQTQDRQNLEDNTQLIISFMVDTNASYKHNQDGMFWQLLVKSDWSVIDKVYESREVQMRDESELMNVEGVVDEGLEMMQQSFYYYQGSLSQPPCSPGVHRVVMLQPIPLSTYTFNTIRQQVLLTHPTYNSRHLQQALYQITKHIDHTKRHKCTKINNNALQNKLSAKEYIDYQKLMLGLDKQHQALSSVYRELNNQENRLQKQKVVEREYNYEAHLKTNVNHVQKISKKLARKLFNTQDLLTLQQGHQLPVGSQLDITFLGADSQDYQHKLATNTNKTPAVQKAQKLITIHDQQQRDNQQYHNIILKTQDDHEKINQFDNKN